MKQTQLLMLSICAVLALAAGDAATTHANRRQEARPPEKRATFSQPARQQNHLQAKGAATQKRASKKAEAKPTVHEVDGAGLARLLLRDPARPRPLLVNFWATWCEPCRVEFPDLIEIDKQYRPRGLEFITVSLDDVAEISRNVPDFLQSMRAAHVPAYLLNAVDPDEAINAIGKGWRGELPATFLFDGRGQLVFKHSGRIKPAELREAIEKTMNAER